ncbi:MAG: helix-turn-helix domain-containing protein [Aristaeellaceae bacterium]
MYLNDLMAKHHMTREELCRLSGVPDSTLRGILSGGVKLERCQAGTLHRLAKAMNTSVEELLGSTMVEPEPEYPPSRPVHEDGTLMTFYVLLDAVTGKLHAEGELAFVRQIRENDWIGRYYRNRMYRITLFLLGLSDYLCRKHGISPDPRYDTLRHLRLDRPVYSLDTLEKDDCGSFEQAKAWAENHAIPELARFNIFLTEDDLRRKV